MTERFSSGELTDSINLTDDYKTYLYFTSFHFASWILQGYSYDQTHGLGGLGFGMLHQLAWAVGSNSSGPSARGTHQIRVNPTHVSDCMDNLVSEMFGLCTICQWESS